jgi:hypothetical protein
MNGEATAANQTNGKQKSQLVDSTGANINAANPLPIDVTTATIEQTTAATHNDLNITVAGKDTAGKVRPLITDTAGKLILSTLVPFAYDYIALTYVDTDLTKAEYYTGGSGGTKVATLTLAYTAHVLQTVTRS